MAQYVVDNAKFPIDFQLNDMEKRTLQNAKNLLMLRLGEVPYDRLRGFDTSLFELPITELNDVLVEELERVMTWEPDVEVIDGEASVLPNGQVYITCKLLVGESYDDDEDEDIDGDDYTEPGEDN